MTLSLNLKCCGSNEGAVMVVIQPWGSRLVTGGSWQFDGSDDCSCVSTIVQSVTVCMEPITCDSPPLMLKGEPHNLLLVTPNIPVSM